MTFLIKSILIMSAAVVFTTTIPSCRAQVVVYDRDSGTDFRKFKTYAWLAPGDSVLNRYRRDKLYGGTITYAANQELASRGLKMDTLNPDAIFVFYTTREEIVAYSQTPQLSIGLGVGGPGYYVAGMAPVAGGEMIITTKQEGELKYAMYDTTTRKLVWTGQVTKTFKLTEDVNKLVMDYTAKIFKKFPVKKNKQ